MPGYQNLLDRYGARGFVVIGLKFDTMPDMENPLQFAREIGARYPLAVATEDVKQKLGGIEGLPTTMLYDRQGIQRTKIVGFEYTDIYGQVRGDVEAASLKPEREIEREKIMQKAACLSAVACIGYGSCGPRSCLSRHLRSRAVWSRRYP
jgi:hypothetical protein